MNIENVLLLNKNSDDDRFKISEEDMKQFHLPDDPISIRQKPDFEIPEDEDFGFYAILRKLELNRINLVMHEEGRKRQIKPSNSFLEV